MFTLNSWGSFYLYGLTGMKARLSKNIGRCCRDTIIHPCPNFNGGLTKPSMKLGHSWVGNPCVYMDVITYPRHNPDTDVKGTPVAPFTNMV